MNKEPSLEEQKAVEKPRIQFINKGFGYGYWKCSLGHGDLCAFLAKGFTQDYAGWLEHHQRLARG